ncbi:tetratricopeptide repeat protein [bacterium]|nr:tetratricopeptide repeat protein [bacterium]
MRSALAGKNSVRLRPALTALLLFGVFPGLFASYDNPRESDSHYYNRLRTDDFMKMMIPKEKFLLGLVKDVSDELAARRAEGQSVKDLGIDEATSPKDVLKSDYDSEVRAMEELISQIESLELQAKRRVDLDVLKSLEQLKERLKTFLNREIVELNEQHEKQAARIQSDAQGKRASSFEGSMSVPGADSTSEFGLGSGDLFEQWKYNRILDYKLKLAKYQFYRMKLRKNANAVQAQRIFQRDLQRALKTYNSADFELSRLQLQDVLDQYLDSHVLDDVMYYRCESSYGLNYLDEALDGYEKLTVTYPNSEYAAKAMVKMIFIHYIYGDVEKQVDLYQRLIIRKSQISAGTWGTTTYLVGYSQFRSGQFRKALETLRNTGTGSVYYFPSLYLSAACHSNLGENDRAIQLYQQLIERIGVQSSPMLGQLKNNAQLKLGLIYYEKGQTQLARDCFNRVAVESENYDLSVLGDAWAAYREGRPAEALKSVETLLDDNLISNYMYEAKVLAASSKELLGDKEAALRDLKQVTEMGKQARSGSRRGSAADVERPLRNEQERILYQEAKRIQQFLRGDLETVHLEAADQSEFAGTQEKLQGEIATLDQLENLAMDDENPTSLSQIRQLRGQVIETLQDHGTDDKRFKTSQNDAPLIRQMGMTEYLKYLFRSLLLETLSQKDKIHINIASAEQLMNEARDKGRYNISLQMEINREELEDYYLKLNQYEVWLKENLPQEFRIEVDQWTSFSSYGISNLYFTRIQEIDERSAQISRIMASLDRVFQDKRIKLERRIQGLLSDVARIEAQMQVESKRRKEQERDSFFNNKYFNKQVKEPVVQ